MIISSMKPNKKPGVMDKMGAAAHLLRIIANGLLTLLPAMYWHHFPPSRSSNREKGSQEYISKEMSNISQTQ
jgi:hypothetical protein